MHTTTAFHIPPTHPSSFCFAQRCTKGAQAAILASLIFLAFLSTATAANFSGSLKEVSITDAQATNKPPTAKFTYSISGDTVTFDASGSSDSDGTINKFKWDFGDGGVSEGISTTHLYTSLSMVPVTLTVLDDKKGVSIAQQIITKSAPQWIGETLGKSIWTLVYVDSQETTGENGAAANAFDNNPSTIWHTEWLASSPPPPHQIQIDLKNTYTIDGLRYLPRQDSTNGQVCDYEFYISNDTNNWGTPVSKGTFDNTLSEKEKTFAYKNGRYVRFVANRECNNKLYTSIAEIDFHMQ